MYTHTHVCVHIQYVCVCLFLKTEFLSRMTSRTTQITLYLWVKQCSFSAFTSSEVFPPSLSEQHIRCVTGHMMNWSETEYLT